MKVKDKYAANGLTAHRQRRAHALKLGVPAQARAREEKVQAFTERLFRGTGTSLDSSAQNWREAYARMVYEAIRAADNATLRRFLEKSVGQRSMSEFPLLRAPLFKAPL